MKEFYDYADWKMTRENRNIGSQMEVILCVFYNFPCYFSRTELKVFLGYKSPNHNVDGALLKMVQELMIFKTHNKVGTEIYYLGNFGMKLLGRHKTPEKNSRTAKYIHHIVIRSENGHRVINNRVLTKRQDLTTTKSTKVTPSAKRRNFGPQVKLPSSNNDSSKGTIDSSSKNSEEEKEDDELDDESTSDYSEATKR
jgi:hypothetical protein